MAAAPESSTASTSAAPASSANASSTVRRAPTSSDAYLLALKQIDPVEDLKALPSKPCARQALLLGIGGGTAIGAIRFVSSRRPLASSNWAVAAFALLSLTSWETCRRSHAKEQVKMKALMADYRNKASGSPSSRKPNEGASTAVGNDKTVHAPAVGGVFMGQKAREMMAAQGHAPSSGSAEEGKRLV